MDGWSSKGAKAIASFVLLSLLGSILAPGVASQTVNQDPVQQGQDLLKLSQEQNYSNHPLALATAHDALALFENAGDKPGIASAYFHIATAYLAMSDLSQATENYQTALAHWRELNDAGNQAASLIHLGFVEQRKGDWPSANSYYTQAQALSQNDPYTLGQIANALGYLFSENGMPENGLVQFQQSLAYYQQAQNDRAIKRATMDIAITKLLLNDYAAALKSLQEVLPTLDPAKADAAECHENLGRVYLALQNYQPALDHLQSALSIYEKTHNPVEVERVRMWMAQVYEEQGVLSSARTRYLQALAVFRRLQDHSNEAEVSFRLGRLDLKAGNLDEAETYLKQSIDTTEELRTVSIGRDLTTAYSASVHDRYKAYITCLLRKSKLSAAAGLSEKAFEASELSRARSLIELLRNNQTNLLTGVDRKLTEKERTLRQNIRVKSDQRLQLLGSKGYKQEELKEVESSLERLQAEHRQLYQQLRNLNPAYGEITQPTAWTLQQIQNEVLSDDQTGLVEYFLADEASYVWVVTRNDIKVTELAGEASITKAAQNAHKLLSTKPKDVDVNLLTKALGDLAALVITPIADQLSAQRLIVVADGALHYIPFQALRLPGDKQPLIASREIVNTPSASILGQLRQEKLRRTTPENVVAAFGYPAFDSNYPELRGVNSGDLVAEVQSDQHAKWGSAMRDIEVKGGDLDLSTIRPLFYSREELAKLREVAGPASFFATGFAASRETLEKMDLSKFDILHFATHGVLDPKRPENSGFLLSTVGPDGRRQNGFITVQDVYQLQAPVSLVVLSACSTGLGKGVRGEGLISVTRGFMYAGASSVAASLWNVDDEVTGELMKRFYTNMLQEGMTPAAALRAAQNSVRQQPEWSSPHYWAAFTLQGEYEKPSRPHIKTVALVFLVLLGGIGWWYWRRSRRTGTNVDESHSTRKK